MANWTPEQQAAIDAKGKTVVSASAGSGKTTVMIEKIINLIQADVRVENILAVTFTKKAASQMKEKLRKALVKSINQSSVSTERKKFLKSQLDSVAIADISTIHSFCAKIIRTHFYSEEVDSTFRVIASDDAEGTALQNAALDALLEEGYEKKSPAFMRLLSVYWRKKSDNAFRAMILTVYKELRNRADYREFLQTAQYTREIFDRICGDLLQSLKRKAAYYSARLQEEKYYFESVQKQAQCTLASELEDLLSQMQQAPDYFTACKCEKPKFTVNRTGKNDTLEIKEHAKILGELKAKIVKIYDDELCETGSYEEELQAFLSAGEIASALGEQLLLFDDKYTELKKERSVLDYNDLEHIALKILKKEEVAKEIRVKYAYVFVDEYQDVNPVQEEIISKIGGDDLFLVGDVKQSIYGFRGSKSKFFVEKQKQFEENGHNNLVMKRNFRSSDAVLKAVNEQFSLAMTKQTSSVDYSRDSFMERGGRYALNDGRMQLHLLAEEESEEKNNRGIYSVKANSEKKTREESVVAKTLKTIIDAEIGKTWFNPDANDGAGEYQRVQYKDIAILSRKKQGKIALNVAALSDLGVPITSVSSVNVCDYGEVKTLIDILSLLDNFEQDVPLCSALLSSMGELNLNDLSNIRLAFKEEDFFRRACKKYAENKQDKTAAKLRNFFALYQRYREYAFTMPTSELLTRLMGETRMETRLLAKPNGAVCLKRIHRFIEETETPEPMCVHEFLQKLRDLDYKIEYNENGGENSVKVLTMHASKGLEFPVVIIDDINAPFRGADTDEALVDETYGIATRAFDDKNMLKKGTLLRRLQMQKQTENSVADELNLYYVALTRAKYALHVLFKKPSVFPDIRYARSFADFTDFKVWEENIVRDELFFLPKEERMPLVFRPDENLVQKIISSFTWEYANSGYENLPVKSSATGLMSSDFTPNFSKQAFDFSNHDEDFEYEYEDSATHEKTDKERGIAYHAFLETFDFSRLFNVNGEKIGQESLKEEVARTLLKMQNSAQDLVGYLEKDKLVQILQNPVFYALQGYSLMKEQKFLVSLPIKDTYAKKEGFAHLQDGAEEMIFQGAIDLLAVGKNEAWIIDYKYSQKDKQSLQSHYAPQLELYRLATAKILQIPKERVHCSIVNICLGFQVDMC